MSEKISTEIDLLPIDYREIRKPRRQRRRKPYEPPIHWGNLVIFLFCCAFAFWAHWYVYPNRPPIYLGWLGTIY